MEARFGLLASSKDRDLVNFGIPNDFQSTKRVRFGPWYGDDEDDYSGRSCRRLDTCVTEFGAQGLELDATLLAWGTDLVFTDGRWSNANERGYRSLTAAGFKPMEASERFRQQSIDDGIPRGTHYHSGKPPIGHR